MISSVMTIMIVVPNGHLTELWLVLKKMVIIIVVVLTELAVSIFDGDHHDDDGNHNDDCITWFLLSQSCFSTEVTSPTTKLTLSDTFKQ